MLYPMDVADLTGLLDEPNTWQLSTTVQHIRKLLCQPNAVEQAIDHVLAAGVLPRMIQYIDAKYPAEVQVEAAWALTNIASGNKAQTKQLVDAGAVPPLIALAASFANEELQDQAVWALGNIAGDQLGYRRMLLDAGLMPILLSILERSSAEGLLNNSIWLLGNLFRITPTEEDLVLLRCSLPIFKRYLTFSEEHIKLTTYWALYYMLVGGDFMPKMSGSTKPADLEARIAIVLSYVPRIGAHLSDLLNPNTNLGLQSAAVHLLCALSLSNHEQMQTVLDKAPNLLRKLCHLTHKGRTPKSRCTALTVFSNLVAGSPSQRQAVLDANVLNKLIKCLRRGLVCVKRDALQVLFNLASHATCEQVKQLVQSDLFSGLRKALNVNDKDVRCGALKTALALLTNDYTVTTRSNLAKVIYTDIWPYARKLVDPIQPMDVYQLAAELSFCYE